MRTKRRGGFLHLRVLERAGKRDMKAVLAQDVRVAELLQKTSLARCHAFALPAIAIMFAKRRAEAVEMGKAFGGQPVDVRFAVLEHQGKIALMVSQGEGPSRLRASCGTKFIEGILKGRWFNLVP